MNTIEVLIKAVEENNQFNQARWSDWTDAGHIAETYGEEINELESDWLNRMIKPEKEMNIDLTKSYDQLTYEEDQLLETEFLTDSNWGDAEYIFAIAKENGVDYIDDDGEPSANLALERLYKIEAMRRDFYANWRDFYSC